MAVFDLDWIFSFLFCRVNWIDQHCHLLPLNGGVLMSEEWRDVIGYESIYQVSNLGRVKRIAGGYGARVGRILRPRTGRYPTVALSVGSCPCTHFIHRLVALAFLGSPLEGSEVNHKSGIKTDNRVSNLEWVSPSENRLHATHVLGIASMGEANGQAKLTADQVREIRRLYAQKGLSGNLCYTQFELGRLFNVTKANIHLIVNHKRWKHV